jgi:hypothetical protein
VANVVVPASAVAGLEVPARAITDGSPDPVWVDISCRPSYLYGRRRTVRLPFDAVTAGSIGRLMRHERRLRIWWTPLGILFWIAGSVTLITGVGWGGVARWLLLGAALGIQTVTVQVDRKLRIAQQPEMVGPAAVYFPAVEDHVAEEWVRLNPAARVVPRNPGWRRYPGFVYVLAAVASVAIAVFIWRVGDSPFREAGTIVLTLAAAGFVFLAVPPGFIRFEERTR